MPWTAPSYPLEGEWLDTSTEGFEIGGREEHWYFLVSLNLQDALAMGE